MKFTREDYQSDQRRKWASLTAVFIAAIIVIWILSDFFNRPAVETREQTKNKVEDLMAFKSRLPAGKRAKKPKKAKRVKKDLPTLVKEAKGAVAVIHTFDSKGKPAGQGTGFFINQKGHMVSNYHVFRGAERAEVKLPSGTYQVNKVLAEDSGSDLILFSIKIQANRYRALPISEQKPVVGERIVVIGNPLGLESTVSDGIVSAHRQLRPFGDVIQITSPISPGSSGSPVFNMFGEVIGVATFQSKVGQNLNFAIPVKNTKKLISTGERELADLSFADSDELAGAGTAFDRGVVYYEAGEYKKAIDEFKQVIRKEPTNAEAHYYLGMSYKKERPYDAVRFLKLAIELDLGNLEAYCELGTIYNEVEMFRDAIQTLQQALAVDSDCPAALIQLGIAYSSSKDHRAAVKILERAIDVVGSAEAYFYLGYAYIATRTYDKAFDAFDESVNRDPDFFEAYLGLGYCYAAFGNWEKGIHTLKQAYFLEPGHPETHFLLGLMYLGNNDPSSADFEIRKLREIKRKWSGKSASAF
ncbi:MAG: trypsin-like peptidase domain-containing protein, partial [Candidatus Aminicenantes bacterium]|nr:trypsin-like peptidase domain-containing protein [Candidatus Aminicenantes bacterium]